MSVGPSLDELGSLLAAGRFDLTTEKACQVDIALLLGRSDVAFSREHRLGAGEIPDFLVEGGVAVEVKLNRQRPAEILRQLGRYAAHEAVTAIVLASNRFLALPATIGGKPARFVSLGRAWL